MKQEGETKIDTEAVLAEFMRTELKTPPKEEKEIYFDGEHRISTRARDGRDSEPRPIIVKFPAFQGKKKLSSPL